MGVTDLLKVPKRVIIRNQEFGFDLLTFDASIKETHVSKSVITDFPVESGPNVSDNSRPMPETLTLQIAQTSLPLSTSVLPGLPPAPEAFGTRWQSAYNQLIVLKDEATLLEVTTTLRIYEDLLIESVEVPRDAKTADGIFATVVFKRVFVAGDVSFTGNGLSFRKKTPVGKKSVSKVSKPQADKASFLFSATR